MTDHTYIIPIGQWSYSIRRVNGRWAVSEGDNAPFATANTLAEARQLAKDDADYWTQWLATN